MLWHPTDSVSGEQDKLMTLASVDTVLKLSLSVFSAPYIRTWQAEWEGDFRNCLLTWSFFAIFSAFEKTESNCECWRGRKKKVECFCCRLLFLAEWTDDTRLSGRRLCRLWSSLIFVHFCRPFVLWHLVRSPHNKRSQRDVFARTWCLNFPVFCVF